MPKRPRLHGPDRTEITCNIEMLTQLSLADVRKRWCEVFLKRPPTTLTQDLMVRQLAWRIQEGVFGGHDRETLKLLDACARQDPDKAVLYKRLKPGSSVVREYQGVRHIVTISEGGFVWQDKTYSSLSVTARDITGARWNGPRFFGLRMQGKSPETRAS